MAYVPYVVDNTGREERVYDIYSRLLKDRIIFLGTQVTADLANSLVAQMLPLAPVIQTSSPSGLMVES